MMGLKTLALSIMLHFMSKFLFLDFSDLTSQTAALLDQGMELAIDHVDLLSQLVQRFEGAAHIPYPVPKSGTLVWL